MTEIVNLLFHPLSNAIMTVVTGITAVYWILTFLAHDFLGDIGLPTADGVDIDADTGADLDNNIGGKSFFSQALEFVNVGKVPFMVVYSVFKFMAWILTLASSVVLGAVNWGWRSVVLLLPVFIVTFFLTRYATKPLVKVYDAMGYNGEEKLDLLGRIARMKTAVSGDKMGAAELVIKNDVIRINVRSKNGAAIPYNADVMIASESPDRRFYYVVPEITLGNIV